VHFGLLSPPCTFPGIQINDTLHIVFFCTFFNCRLPSSGLRQPSHPACIFSGIFLDPFYLLPDRRLLAHVTLVKTIHCKIFEQTGFLPEKVQLKLMSHLQQLFTLATITAHTSFQYECQMNFPWSGWKNWPTEVNVDFIDSKLRERHFVTKNLINKYQIATSTGLSSFPFLKIVHTSTLQNQTDISQLLASRYVLCLGDIKNNLYCNFTLSLSITGNIKVLQEQFFFSHVHNPLNLTTSSRRLAQSIVDLAKWQFSWWHNPNNDFFVSALATPITKKPHIKTAADWVHPISATLPKTWFGCIWLKRRD